MTTIDEVMTGYERCRRRSTTPSHELISATWCADQTAYAIEDRILELARTGVMKQAIAAELKISIRSVFRILAETKSSQRQAAQPRVHQRYATPNFPRQNSKFFGGIEGSMPRPRRRKRELFSETIPF
jgi:hypothetical protein